MAGDGVSTEPAPQRERKKRKWDQPAENVPATSAIAMPGIGLYPNVAGLGGMHFAGTASALGHATQSAQIMPNFASLQQNAAAVVAKINEDLASKGLLPRSALPQPKLQDEPVFKEITINDTEPAVRAKLLRRQTQEEVQAKTGAVVITRGKFHSPRDPPLANGEKALYLHVSSGITLKDPSEKQKAVDEAVAMIEEILSQNSAVPSLSVYAGIAPDAGFDLIRRISGPNGQYLEHIAKETGAKVTLRGQGSGNLEGRGAESSEPLHIQISCKNPKGLEDGRRLAENLMQFIRGEYASTQRSRAHQYPPPSRGPQEAVPALHPSRPQAQGYSANPMASYGVHPSYSQPPSQYAPPGGYYRPQSTETAHAGSQTNGYALPSPNPPRPPSGGGLPSAEAPPAEGKAAIEASPSEQNPASASAQPSPEMPSTLPGTPPPPYPPQPGQYMHRPPPSQYPPPPAAAAYGQYTVPPQLHQPPAQYRPVPTPYATPPPYPPHQQYPGYGPPQPAYGYNLPQQPYSAQYNYPLQRPPPSGPGYANYGGAYTQATPVQTVTSQSAQHPAPPGSTAGPPDHSGQEGQRAADQRRRFQEIMESDGKGASPGKQLSPSPTAPDTNRIPTDSSKLGSMPPPSNSRNALPVPAFKAMPPPPPPKFSEPPHSRMGPPAPRQSSEPSGAADPNYGEEDEEPEAAKEPPATSFSNGKPFWAA